jgi:two-component system LytT family response regulator
MKCLVVDDDPLTCDMVESFLKRIGGIDYCLKVNDGTTALHLLATESFDAVFLDLELPGMDGVSLIKALPRQTSVVVISASASFGAASYAFDVVDYMVKPLEFTRFARAVVKLKEGHASTPATGQQKTKDVLFLREGTSIQRVDLSKIAYIEAQSNYALFVLDDGSSIMSLVSMRKLEKMLPEEFIRIHRSYMVNRSRISNIEGSKLTVNSKALPIGQSYRDLLMEKLKVIN